jgi:hypothetical protein
MGREGEDRQVGPVEDGREEIDVKDRMCTVSRLSFTISMDLGMLEYCEIGRDSTWSLSVSGTNDCSLTTARYEAAHIKKKEAGGRF